MNEELQNIKDIATWAEAWYPVASAVQALCEYIAKLEERLEKLEAAANANREMTAG